VECLALFQSDRCGQLAAANATMWTIILPLLAAMLLVLALLRAVHDSKVRGPSRIPHRPEKGAHRTSRDRRVKPHPIWAAEKINIMASTSLVSGTLPRHLHETAGLPWAGESALTCGSSSACCLCVVPKLQRNLVTISSVSLILSPARRLRKNADR
jgi:hypothetical protein